MDEVLAWADREIGHYAMYFFADNLDFSGEADASAGFLP